MSTLKRYNGSSWEYVGLDDSAISTKADKVSGATNGDVAGLDANGNLTDTGISATSVSTAVTDAHTHSNKTYLDKIPTSVGSNGQVLTSNGSAWSWANVPTELPTQTGQSGKFLTTNGSAVSWANTPTELPSITGNAEKILAVNSGATGVEWITNSGGGGSSTLAGLTDTNISSPTNGQVLSYDSATSKWVNSNSGGGGLTNYNFTHTSNASASSSVTVTFAADTRGTRMITVTANINVTFAVNNLSDNYLWIKNNGSSTVNVTLGGVSSTAVTVSTVYAPTDGISIDAGKLCEIGIVVNSDGAFITSRSDLSILIPR